MTGYMRMKVKQEKKRLRDWSEWEREREGKRWQKIFQTILKK